MIALQTIEYLVRRLANGDIEFDATLSCLSPASYKIHVRVLRSLPLTKASLRDIIATAAKPDLPRTQLS